MIDTQIVEGITRAFREAGLSAGDPVRSLACNAADAARVREVLGLAGSDIPLFAFDGVMPGFVVLHHASGQVTVGQLYPVHMPNRHQRRANAARQRRTVHR